MTTKPPPPTLADLESCSVKELERRFSAHTPMGGWPEAKKLAKSQAEDMERRNRQRAKELPLEPPIPEAIAASVVLPHLDSVRDTLAQCERRAAEREALAREDDEAAAEHELLPPSTEGVELEREFQTGREARRVRMETLTMAEVKLRAQSEELLAADIKQLQASVTQQSSARMAEVVRKLQEVLELLEDEHATERAALREVGRVGKALARFPLGPAVKIIAGEERRGAGHDVSPVNLGRRPPVIRQLDNPARRVIRGFLENHRIGMNATPFRHLGLVLSLQRVREAIAAAKKEI